MPKRLLSLLTCIVSVALLAGCAPQAATQITTQRDPAQDPQRVVFLLVQPLSPFEIDIWDAIARARDDGYASEIKLIEMKDPAEYEATIRRVSEEGYDVVVGAFFLIKEPFLKVAPDFPNTHYVLVNESVPDPVSAVPNMIGIVYDVQEGSYVCGVVAAHMTTADRVGFIGGSDFPGIIKFLAGYEAGLKAVKPNLQLDVAFAGTFTDPDKGYEVGTSLYERGDDVVMHAANKTGLGLFVAAAEQGAYAIGVDIDQTDQAPTAVLCSALTNPGASVYQAIYQAATAKWAGGNLSWGVDDGQPAAALNTKLLPADVVKAAQDAEAKLKSGEITVPVTTETR
jgi:basic membrane protein A and related proteins